MSVQPLNEMFGEPDVVGPRHDSGAAFRDQLRGDLRRAAIEHGVDLVRVRELLHAVDQATRTVQAGTDFSEATLRLNEAVAALFPDNPGLVRALLERAVLVLMVASAWVGGELGGQVLDKVLASAGGSKSSPVIASLTDHAVSDSLGRARALRREVDADPFFQALFSTSTTGVCLVSPEGITIRANDRYRNILGIETSDVIGVPQNDFHHGRLMYSDEQHEEVQRHASLEAPRLVLDVLIRRSDGLLGWVVLDSTLVRDAGDAPRYFLTLIDDISHRRITAQAIAGGDGRLHALVQNTSDVFGIVTQQGRIEYVSESIERMLGYAPGSLHGSDFLSLTDGHGRDAMAAAIQSARDRPFEPSRVGASLRHFDGSTRWMEIDFTRLDDDDGISGVVFSARDVTARKAVEEQLERLAYYDHLTTLPNRIQFRERLDEALEAAATTGERVGVIFIDIDRFKSINDRYGHDGGDAVLTAVGRRLTTAVHSTDLASRFGGDEFLILLRNTSPKSAMRSAGRVIRAIATADPGHPLEEPIALSAGVAIWSPDMQSSRDLLRAADVALYRSKARGGNVATLYDPGLTAYAGGLVVGEG